MIKKLILSVMVILYAMTAQANEKILMLKLAMEENDIPLLIELVDQGLDINQEFLLSDIAGTIHWVIIEDGYRHGTVQAIFEVNPLQYYLNSGQQILNEFIQSQPEDNHEHLHIVKEKIRVNHFSKEFLLAMIELGANIYARSSNLGIHYEYSLSDAIYNNNAEAIEVLLSLGALYENGKECTLGHHQSLVSLLLSKKVTEIQEELLMNILQQLVLAGASITETDINGMTPLKTSRMNQHLEAEKFLLEHGAIE